MAHDLLEQSDLIVDQAVIGLEAARTADRERAA
jgi:hypothetical protein